MFPRSFLRWLAYPVAALLLMVSAAPPASARAAQGRGPDASGEAAPLAPEAGVLKEIGPSAEPDGVVSALAQKERRIVLFDALPALPPPTAFNPVQPVQPVQPGPALVTPPAVISSRSSGHGKWIAVGAAVGAIVATVLFVGRSGPAPPSNNLNSGGPPPDSLGASITIGPPPDATAAGGPPGNASNGRGR